MAMSLVEPLTDPFRTGAQNARIVLCDGATFHGLSVGFDGSCSGEVVFNTGMVGYPEALTDPSYFGQILVFTYPLVGNYGVPIEVVDSQSGLSTVFESDSIHVRGVVMSDYSFTAAHHAAGQTLADWLKKNKIPAISGIDTRALTKHIRTHGSPLGKIVVGDMNIDSVHQYVPDDFNLVRLVSRLNPKEFRSTFVEGRRTVRILAVDCGIKFSLIHRLLKSFDVNVILTVVPWDFPFGTLEAVDGVFLSNGPGNPDHCKEIVDNIRIIMQRGISIFGVCLGNQLLGLAAGAKTYKMKFGNRGMNQPVVDLRTSRCYITPQNHGYAIDSKSLQSDWAELFVNANDQSNEGLIHRSRPWFSVQFHPEAAGGPPDTNFLFSEFLVAMTNPRGLPVSTIPFLLQPTPSKIIILGSGGLSIGQAGEFDYSGTQAIKALRESHVTTILVNPNIATVQTSPGLADKIYFLPITPYFIRRVIHRERPNALLCAFGGQTALNCAIELYNSGYLKTHNVTILGTKIPQIIATEDRECFAGRVASIGLRCAPSIAAHSVEECIQAAEKIGYPVLVRAGFALGGLGSGFAGDSASLECLARNVMATNSSVIVDKSLKGWKEIEYEILRDGKDNCIAVCNMENLDPLGIHTGDSIVVAPSQTLSNRDYYNLRSAAILIARHFEIIGECNVQFAVDPKSGDFVVVEVNARLSRSSALASKATAYPLAYIAAKLSLGHDLPQLRNCVSRSTTACFEPSLDYVVVKVPKWDLSKFSGTADRAMGSVMKSVGEAMAVGRTFEEAIQKGLRMVTDGRAFGFNHVGMYTADDENQTPILEELTNPSPQRIWALACALSRGVDVSYIFQHTQIDFWFLAKLRRIVLLRLESQQCQSLEELGERRLRSLKIAGFCDREIATYFEKTTAEDVRSFRRNLNIIPMVKQIDTLAAEFPVETNYLYTTYQGVEHDVLPTSQLEAPSPASSPRCFFPSSRDTEIDQIRSRVSLRLEVGDGEVLASRPHGLHLGMESSSATVVVLGCGCYHIGSSVEFDWSAMSCVRTLRSLGIRAIVVNCNPETVSTDFDESDRLYFEDISLETVLDIYEFEQPAGIIISVGGQSPNNLAVDLGRHGANILGTSATSIDTCEDRNKFSRLCDTLGIDQPSWSQFTTITDALAFSESVGFPVLVRPSYVLSGATMRAVANRSQLRQFLNAASVVSCEHPVVISKYIDHAKEVEVDAVAAEGEMLNFAISEHVENAGVHSGDATLILPAQKLYVETTRKVLKISRRLARALMISGPFNVQFICKQNEVKVIECNLRASRTLPFISKTFNLNLVEQSTRVAIGVPVRIVNLRLDDFDYVAVKSPVFSFARIRGADPLLGVEMRSTGEVAGFGTNKFEAFLKAWVASGSRLPEKGFLVSAGPLAAKVSFVPFVVNLMEMGFEIYATTETHRIIKEHLNDRPLLEKLLIRVSKPSELGNDAMSVVSIIESGAVDCVVNIPRNLFDRKETTDGFVIRRLTTDRQIPLITDVKLAELLVESLCKFKQSEIDKVWFWDTRSWDEVVRVGNLYS